MAFSLSKTQSNGGFSFIELLIVITIMGILTAAIAFSIREMIYRGRVARAQGDLNTIGKAIRQLELDTNKQPGGETVSGCNGNNALVLNTAGDVGLMNNSSATFTNWKGPYIDELPTDPWGQSYIFDADYHCEAQIKGCEKVGTDTVKVIHSGGQNRSGIDVYDDDDIVLVMCTQ